MAAVTPEEHDLDFEQREIVLRASFDGVDGDECLGVSIRFLMDGPRPPKEGEWVYLLDPRGDGCLGQIESINGWEARVRPDWTTWAGREPPPLH